MWYAMQIKGGSEKKLVQLCRGAIQPSLLKECFYPRYERLRKEKAEQKIVTRSLFPGYVFVDTEDVKRLSSQLWKIPELTKIVRIGSEFIPIEPEEEAFIRIHGGKDHIFTISRGYMIGEYVKIEEGAFAGYYGKLEYVNRHKRFGVMKVQMFGKTVEMQFGLEIIRKVDSETEAQANALAEAEEAAEDEFE